MAIGVNQTFIKALKPGYQQNQEARALNGSFFIETEVPDNDSRNNDRGISGLGANLECGRNA